MAHQKANCRSLQESVDWNCKRNRYGCCELCRSLQESVDWNFIRKNCFWCKRSRSLQESVDWNYWIQHALDFRYSRSLQESVDWNSLGIHKFINIFMSLSSGERGLKLFSFPFLFGRIQVALFRRAWIEIKKKYWNVYQLHVALFRRAWIEIITKLGKE